MRARKHISVWICIFLLVMTIPIQGIRGEEILISKDYDADNDGVCDQPKDELANEISRSVSLGCDAVPDGDKCLKTPRSSTVQRSGARSGCSAEEAQMINNFWSVKLGEARPKRVKINWLTDQTTGVEIYQPVGFERNAAIGSENIRFQGVSFYCKDVGGSNALASSVALYYPSNDISKNQGTLVLKLRRFSEDELNAQNILVSKDNQPRTVKDIQLRCTSSIKQCEISEREGKETLDISLTGGGSLRNINPEKSVSENGYVFITDDEEVSNLLFKNLKKDDILKKDNIFYVVSEIQTKKSSDASCQTLYPQETDEFDVLIPIENLALQPPDRALGVGIAVSDNLIKGIDKILGVVEKGRFWSGGICVSSIGFVLLGNLVGKWFEWVDDLAEKWWFGTGGRGEGDKSASGGWFGGKAFCRYYACPIELCPFLQKETGKNLYFDSKGSVKIFDEGESPVGDVAAKYTSSKKETYADKMRREGKSVQDSLVTSVACGCITGIEQNLFKIKIILKEWNRCLNLAKNSDKYVSQCEQYLSEMICTHVLGEFSELGKISVIGKFFSNLRESVAKLFGVDKTSRTEDVRTAVEEAGISKEAIPASESGIGNTKNFFEKEIQPIAAGHARGNLGYKTKGLGTAICEFALYQKIPQYDLLQSLKIDELKLDTSLSASWNSEVAYRGLVGEPAVYEYEISWTVIAGFDNYYYRLYLESDKGAKRYLPLPNNGRIAKIGDLQSDYMQITDKQEYVKLCFDVPLELSPLQCFPPGKYSKGSPFDLSLFNEDEVDDSDGDRLPDWWEKKYNCAPGRVESEFENGNDWKDCRELINSGELNVLSFDSKDSDGDGVSDDKEDPDGDGFINYYEFSNGFNPNVASETADGALVESQCSVGFNKILLEGGQEFSGGKRRYNLGNSIFLKGDYGEAKPSEKDIIADIEITGPGVFFRESKIILSQLKSGVNLWNIPREDGPATGFYKLKVSLVKPKDFAGYDSCINTNKESYGKVAEKEIEFFIYNREKGGCVDSDNGKNSLIQGTCFDGDQPYVDSCGVNGVEEWYCNEKNKCVSENIVCGENLLCVEGACVTGCKEITDKNNDKFVAGVCEYLEYNEETGKYEKIEKKDECISDSSKLIGQYGCVSNQCAVVTPIDDCGEGFVCVNRDAGAVCIKGEEAKTVAVEVEEFEPVEGVGILSADKVKKDMDTTKKNLGVLTGDIWSFIKSQSTENGIDFKLILALISVESQGQNKRSPAGAIGIMQIVPGKHIDSSTNKPIYDPSKLESNERYNLQSGIKILKDKYTIGSNNFYYTYTINKYCSASNYSTLYIKFLSYKGWNRALRLYNGAACGCGPNCDDDYVEKVNQYYEAWGKEEIPSIIVAGR